MTADSETILITLIQQSICIFGLIFNSAIVWITIKNKNLQNSYGYFLAIYSFCEALFESATFLPTVLILIDAKISLLSCFYATVLQTMWAVPNAAFALLFISFDRILAIIFPIFYRFVIKSGAGKFVIALNLLSTGYSFIIMYFDWLFYVWDQRQTPVYCNPGDQVNDYMCAWGLLNIMTAYLVTIVNYIIIGVYIKIFHSTNQQMAQNRQIYKTLVMITCAIFFFYFLGAFLVYISPILANGNPQMEFFYFRIFALLMIMAGAVNAPVLYICSTEYRNTMNRQFPFLLPLLKVCRVVPMTNNNNPIALPSAITIQAANQTQIHPSYS